MKKSPSPTIEKLRGAWRAVSGDGCSGVPDFGFTDDCNAHDRDYRIGHDENGRPVSRLRADWRLLCNMLKNQNQPRLKRILLAPIFFVGVRLFGWIHHNPPAVKI